MNVWIKSDIAAPLLVVEVRIFVENFYSLLCVRTENHIFSGIDFLKAHDKYGLNINAMGLGMALALFITQFTESLKLIPYISFNQTFEKERDMKTLKKMTRATVAVLLMIGGACAVQAATLDTTTATPNDGILQNFSGIDWNANGAAWVQGFGLTSSNNAGDSDTFTLTYQGFASSIGTTTPTPNLYVASPGPATGGYELTMYSTINETATCLTAGCTAISIATSGGVWQVYFDISPDANQALGTGFRTDSGSVQILGGAWTGGNSLFSAALATGGGNLYGTVTSTNNTYVNPDLFGTTLQASLAVPRTKFTYLH